METENGVFDFHMENLLFRGVTLVVAQRSMDTLSGQSSFNDKYIDLLVDGTCLFVILRLMNDQQARQLSLL